jgi:ribosome maturation factor RimP
MGLRPIFRFNGTVGRGLALNKLRDELTALLAPTVSDAGMELWALEYNPRAGGELLRLYIDSAQGVTVDDCERVSHAVSAVLDADDPIPGQYTLEVSSPGLDRVLRTPEHFARFVGDNVRVETSAPIENRKRFSGCLLKAEAEQIEIQVDGRKVVIPIAAIHKARLVPAD